MAKKNPELPSLETRSIPEIEEAAEEYFKLLNKRKLAKENEDGAAAVLVSKMDRHREWLSVDGDGNRVYRYDDKLVTLKEHEATAVVKIVPSHEGEDQD